MARSTRGCRRNPPSSSSSSSGPGAGVPDGGRGPGGGASPGLPHPLATGDPHFAPEVAPRTQHHGPPPSTPTPAPPRSHPAPHASGSGSTPGPPRARTAPSPPRADPPAPSWSPSPFGPTRPRRPPDAGRARLHLIPDPDPGPRSRGGEGREAPGLLTWLGGSSLDPDRRSGAGPLRRSAGCRAG